MLELNGNNICLTRGDSAYLTVQLVRSVPGEPVAGYGMQAGDSLKLTVKRNARADAAIQKVLRGTQCFHLIPSDTAELPFGCYHYDVQLTTENGDIFTVIANGGFTSTAGVTV